MNPREAKHPADWPKKGLYFCLHHKVKCEYTHNIDERWDYSCKEKAYHELEVRLSAMRPVKGKLLTELTLIGAKHHAAWVKRDAAWVKLDAEWAKLDAAWAKLDAEQDKLKTTWVKRDAAWAKLAAAWAKLDAARAKRDAARAKLKAAQAKLDAAQAKYDAALIRYAPEIDALFAIECADVPWGENGLIFPEEKE